MAFVIDCHDREVLAHVAAPRSMKGSDIRLLMERALWRHFGEAALGTPHAIQWLSDNGPQYTATESVFYPQQVGAGESGPGRVPGGRAS